MDDGVVQVEHEFEVLWLAMPAAMAQLSFREGELGSSKWGAKDNNLSSGYGLAYTKLSGSGTLD